MDAPTLGVVLHETLIAVAGGCTTGFPSPQVAPMIVGFSKVLAMILALAVGGTHICFVISAVNR